MPTVLDPMQVAAIRVLLVEDHLLVREAIAHVLAEEADLRVVGEAGDAGGALHAARMLRPDVVVLDVGLPGISGVAATSRLLRLVPRPRVVALSAHAQPGIVQEMLRAGASGYVTKSSAGTELVRAIHAAHAGERYFSADIAERVIGESRDAAAARSRLAAREREVLCLVARGLRSSCIAEELGIRVTTVEVHRRNIMRKLGLRSIAELTLYAVREGLVSL